MATGRGYSIGSSDIVKQGYLYVKRPPGNRWNKLKAWHKRFFILRDSGAERGPELFMYNSQQEGRNCDPVLNLYLKETVHIGITSESHRFANVLVVVFNGKSPLLLAAEDELTARSWMLALDLTSQSSNAADGSVISWSTVNSSLHFPRCSSQASATTGSDSIESDGSGCSCAPAFVRESQILCAFAASPSGDRLHSSFDCYDTDNFNVGAAVERFPICFLMTEASEKVGLRGHLQLISYSRAVGVARVGDTECFLLWPISVVRQYRLESFHKNNCVGKNKSKNRRTTLVTVEVGRRCSTGEGVFQFTTTQGEEIMRELKKAVSNWASFKAKNQSSIPSARTASTLKSCSHDSCRYLRSNLKDHHHNDNYGSGFLQPKLTSAYGSTSLSPSSVKEEITSVARASEKEPSNNVSEQDVNYITPVFDEQESSDYVESESVDLILASDQINPNPRRDSSDLYNLNAMVNPPPDECQDNYLELLPT